MIPSTSLFANAAIAREASILQDIHLPAKNIAIYQRDITTVKEELKQSAEQEIEFRASGSIVSILDKLEDYFQDHSISYPALIEDIKELLNLFKKTTQASSFRLLLATVSTNMCRKFHTDVNDLRMLCTYLGQGTLWLPDEAVDPKTSRSASHELVIDAELIQQIPAGDVVILKGALYPDADPILHRSPTIEESGETRLLLRIDTNESLNF
jgi:hypothetical protein